MDVPNKIFQDSPEKFWELDIFLWGRGSPSYFGDMPGAFRYFVCFFL